MFAALLLLQATLPAPAWAGSPRPLVPALAETSALAASRRHPGVLWTLNDGDNPAELFAVDTAGRLLGVVRIAGAENQDWEALAAGPCPRSDRWTPPGCLYIGDIGDNSRRRPFITVYVVAEPRPGRDTVTRVRHELRIAYPDSARDAEAMVVDGRGDLWIVSKELVREPRIYHVPAAAWRSRRIATAEYATALPIPSASGVEQWTTDAAWSPEGEALLVRTYGALWRVPFAHGRPHAAGTRLLCGLGGLGPQGEGLAALGGDLYAVSSERFIRSHATLALVRCAE